MDPARGPAIEPSRRWPGDVIAGIVELISGAAEPSRAGTGSVAGRGRWLRLRTFCAVTAARDRQPNPPLSARRAATDRARSLRLAPGLRTHRRPAASHGCTPLQWPESSAANSSNRCGRDVRGLIDNDDGHLRRRLLPSGKALFVMRPRLKLA